MTAPPPEIPAPPGFVRSVALALRWELLDGARGIPIAASVQLVVALGLAVGLANLSTGVDVETTRYLATGAPTLAIVALGLVSVPQTVTQRRTAGAYEFLDSLPIAPTAPVIASVLWSAAFSLPGAGLALVAASLHFDLDLELQPVLLPAVVLGALVMTAVGYGIASIVTNPYATSAVTQLFLFGTMLFAPVNFPADRLPSWLASLHEWLPVAPLAALIRSGVGVGDTRGRDLAVLVAWAVAGSVVAARAATRRS